jgi:hypothetical protein
LESVILASVTLQLAYLEYLCITQLLCASHIFIFVHDLLNLISAEMLVINPKERILSGPLNNELKCMIDKGVETPLYLTAPRPSSPRPQQKLQSSSLAAAVWNGLVRAPSPNEGMALPGRSSMASIPQISPGHLQSLEDISPPTSPRPNS